MSRTIVVQAPAHPTRLVILFHGVGSDAPDLVPLGQWIGRSAPEAAIVSVAAPFPSDFGSGRQWFSVQGVTEDSRPERVAQALPAFEAVVKDLQAHYRVPPRATVLVGFSQGAIMALESARAQLGLAATVVSIAGRFARLPDEAPAGTAFHFLHGERDGVIDPAHARDAAQRLQALGATVTLDLFDDAGHQVHAPIARRLVERLSA